MSPTQSSSLLRVIEENISDKDLRLMMRWRKENERFYAEQPKITHASFKRWFKDYYVDKRRILFFVMYRGRKIGHMGLYEMRGRSCKIDNVLRGESYGKGVMGQALRELLAIAGRMFLTIYLKVRADNDHAIRFYLKHGFTTRGKVYHRGVLSIRMKYENRRLD